MERIPLHLEEFVEKLNEELSSHPECLPGMTITILRPQLELLSRVVYAGLTRRSVPLVGHP
jgi:hypothetical protein